jgi:hypothetical protein
MSINLKNNMYKFIKMEIIINLLILCIVVFIYIHIYDQFKTSNYLEIYEMDNISKEIFEELCDLKQPLLLNNINIVNFDLSNIKENFGNFDVKLINKEAKDTIIPVKLANALDLLIKDTSGNYFSENNKDFLEETSLVKEFSTNDLFLRPIGTGTIEYDMLFGSVNSSTPFGYNLHSRNYLSVLSGSVEVTLCPPKDNKYLFVNKDYDNFKFSSMVDIYNPQPEFKNEFDKVKLLRIILTPNKILQIPAFWFFSIKIIETDTIVANFKYTTYIKALSMIPELFIKFLQNNNIKRNIPTVDV